MKLQLKKQDKRQRAQGMHAQAMIEFALIFPLLIFVLYGLLEFGRLLFIYTSVVNASREAARYGASVGNAGAYRFSDCNGILNAARRNAILNPINASNLTITYDRGPGTTPYATACSTAINNIVALGDRINVTVTITYSPLMPVNFATFPISATSSRTIIRGVEVVGSNVGVPGQPTVYFNSAGPVDPVDEPEGGTVTVSFQVVLDPASTDTVIVPLLVSGDAAQGEDFTINTTTITFVPGDTSETVTITIRDDSRFAYDEYNETVVVTMGNPVNARKGSPSQYTLVIADTDPAPNLYFALAASSGSEDTTQSIAVSLSAVSGKDITFTYDFVEGSSTATEVSDFTLGPASPITIPAGTAGATIQAVLIRDGLYELDEIAQLQLLAVATDAIDPGTPTAVISAPSQHNLTIINIDPKPRISFEVAESITGENIGRVILRVRIDQRSALPSLGNITVSSSSTATLNTDYVLPGSSVTIPAGQSFVDYTITIVNDAEPPNEPDETLILNLAPGDANVQAGTPTTHTVTIKETTLPPEVRFSTASRSADESDGQVAAFLTLSNAWGTDVSVTLSVGGTATQGGDYSLLTPTSLTIPAGYVASTVLLEISNDVLDEDNETVVLTITAASGATIGTPSTYILTILDNDDPPTVSFALASSSYEEGSGNVSLQVNLSTASARNVQVSFAVTGGTAVAGTDYTLLTASPLTFAPGVTSQAISLNLPDDDLYTGTRTVILTLTAPLNATLVAPQTHTLTIIENEVCPTVTDLTFNADQVSTIVALPTGATAVTLKELTLTQDRSINQILEQIYLGAGGSALIFNGSLSASPVTISETGTPSWTGGNRTLNGGEGKVLLLDFKKNIKASDRGLYSIQILWSNGCTARKP